MEGERSDGRKIWGIHKERSNQPAHWLAEKGKIGGATQIKCPPKQKMIE